MSKQMHKLQPEKTKRKPAESPSVPAGTQAETQQQKTFSQLTENYKEFSRKRPQYIKYGLLSIFILPVVFLALMFSLESKLIFLTLWIVSIIAISAFLIVVEYKDYWYRQLLGIDPPEQKEPEGKPDDPADSAEKDDSGKKEGSKVKQHKNGRQNPSPPDPGVREKAEETPEKADNKKHTAAVETAGPPTDEKPKEAEDKKTV